MTNPPSAGGGCLGPIALLVGSSIVGITTMSDSSAFLVTLLALFACVFSMFWGFHRLVVHPGLARAANQAAVNLEAARQNTRDEARRQRRQRGDL
ncbi:hypothetical protein ABZ635_16720 [Nocardiopsis sp. NPDC007018]|uniref:hypothetical protein n=1 Tax=Nocardiopsis sp. NPDC007018 TaxID=3155721 RepID=UPI0033C7F642